jgi:ferredoxin
MRIIKCNHCDGNPECAQVCPTGAIVYSDVAVVPAIDRHSKISDYLKEIGRTAQKAGAD